MIKLTINHFNQSKHLWSLDQNDISQNKHVQNDTLFVQVGKEGKEKIFLTDFSNWKSYVNLIVASPLTHHTHIIFQTKINKILLNMLNEMVVDQQFLFNILRVTKVTTQFNTCSWLAMTELPDSTMQQQQIWNWVGGKLVKASLLTKDTSPQAESLITAANFRSCNSASKQMDLKICM
jgi:hypothetical protein